MTITVEKYNESHIRVFAERDIQVEIKEFFTFKAPGYRWSPKFKAKLWDGNISLYNMQTNKLPTGLFELLKVFASKIDEELVVKENPKYASIYDDDTIEYDDVLEFATSLNLSDSKGNPITAKDYQIEAVYESLKKKRIALSMPTGSGKSLTIYIIIRWLLAKDKRTCLLVPNIGLVKQMISDFMEYSLLNGFDIDEATTLLYSGQERNFNPPVLISTWQTMSKMIKLSYGAEALNSYDCIICDEAHTAKGTEMQKILDMSTDIAYRIGTTGTIDKEKINELMIVGALGPVKKIITTKELMDAGSLSQMKINSFVLQYPEETCKTNKVLSYQDEISYICESQARNKFIMNLCLATSGVTIVFCNFVDKHLIPLYHMISEKAEKHGKQVFIIHGGVHPDERERIRKLVMTLDNAILICSYATAQAGLNIPNISNVVFASPSKSSIRVLQSIGRGLRVHVSKCVMNLFDIVDDMRYKKHENHAFRHFEERMKIYRVEKFDVSIKEFKI